MVVAGGDLSFSVRHQCCHPLAVRRDDADAACNKPGLTVGTATFTVAGDCRRPSLKTHFPHVSASPSLWISLPPIRRVVQFRSARNAMQRQPDGAASATWGATNIRFLFGFSVLADLLSPIARHRRPGDTPWPLAEFRHFWPWLLVGALNPDRRPPD